MDRRLVRTGLLVGGGGWVGWLRWNHASVFARSSVSHSRLQTGRRHRVSALVSRRRIVKGSGTCRGRSCR